MRRIKTADRIISLMIVLAISLMYFTGCAEKAKESPPDTVGIDTSRIAQMITDDIRSTPCYYIESDEISYDVEDYAGDLDAFVYGLIKTEYESCYTVFNATVELPDGETVYGIGYTDYADCYYSDDGKKFFPAGFIALIGEPAVPDDITDKGIEINDLDCEDPQLGFVLAYDTEPFTEQCRIWGQYLKYGIGEDGAVTYSSEEYTGQVDESLGMLYSYDDERYLFDTDFGDYKSITGRSLTEIIDFSAFQADINRRLEEQDRNFCEEDIENTVHLAKERVNAFLLSLQVETFMGCKVSELIEMSKNLDKNECIRITPQGTVVIDFTKDIPREPTALSKWLVGFGCGILIAGSIALDVFVPAMAPISGTISGAAVDVFMQVVIENQSAQNVNWGKVAVSALSGALIAWACPAAGSFVAEKTVGLIGKEFVVVSGKRISTEVFAKFAGYGAKTLSTAFVSGCTNAAFSAIDGYSGEDVFDSFVVGCCVGGAFSAGADLLSAAGGAAVTAFSKTKPGKWLSKYSEKATAWIGQHQVHLENKKLEEILAPKSIHEATRSAMEQLKVPERVKQLPSSNNQNFMLTDNNGSELTKTELINNKGNGNIRLRDSADPDVRAMFEKYSVDEIPVRNGIPDLESISEYSFELTPGISSNRELNFCNCYKQLSREWTENPNLIPEALKYEISEQPLKPATVRDLLKKSGMTLHEESGNIVRIVDTNIHSKISHSGGVAQAKAFAGMETASSGFVRLSKTVPKRIHGTLLNSAA